MKNERIDAIIGEMLDHKITRFEAVGRIEDLYAPHQVQAKVEEQDDLHWVICDKKGKIDVLHVVADCPGGDDCELVKHLNDTGTPLDKYLKRGRQYNATRSGKDWTFKDAGAIESTTEKKT